METDEQYKKLSIVITHPEIAKEWHPTLNKKNRPEKFTRGSSKEKISWQCSKNKEHVWKSDVRKRTKSFDKEKKVNDCEICNSIITTHPEIAKEWHPTKNGDSRLEKCLSGSHGKKIHWQCSKNNEHVWESDVRERTKSFDKEKKVNDCEICNSIITTHPEIAKEWHKTLNKDKIKEQFTYGSNEKVWWQCSNTKEKDHVFYNSIKSRQRNICPCCKTDKITKVVPSNCLISTHPTIAAEWHPTKNKVIGTNILDDSIEYKIDLLAENFTSGSNQRIYWQCINNKNHNWNARIKTRTRVNNPTGCPKCNPKTSKEELSIYYELLTIFKNIKSEYKPKELEKKWVFDYYIPELKLVIEYDGNHWHHDKDQIDTDKLKTKKIEKADSVNPYKALRIREQTKKYPLSKITNNDVEIDKGCKNKIKTIVDRVLEKIKEIFKDEKLNKLDNNTVQLINDYIKKNTLQNQEEYQKELNRRSKNNEKIEKKKIIK